MTFYAPEAADGKYILPEEESQHCIRVLRKRKGDVITVLDGQGGIYEARITDDNSRKCVYEVISTDRQTPDPYVLHLAIAPTKNTDRMEWMIEKCVEIGLHEITFLQCEHSERTRLRLDRLEKKAVSAMKQSGRAFSTKINPLTEFDEFVQIAEDHMIRHIAYVPASGSAPHLKETKQNAHYIVLVGPEGDFSPCEIDYATIRGFMPTSLGNSRLRTETAGLSVCHTLALIHA